MFKEIQWNTAHACTCKSDFKLYFFFYHFGCWSLKPLVIFVTVEHAYHWKMQCPRWHSIPGPLALQATALPTELKKISTNAVSRGGYEPTTVSITLGRGAFPLHSPHLKSHHTLMTISQISTINPTSFPVLITVGYLCRHQCNSRVKGDLQ